MQFWTTPPSGLEVAAFLQLILAISLFMVWLKDRKLKLVGLAVGYVMLAVTLFLPYPEQWQPLPNKMFEQTGRTWAAVNSVALVIILWGVISHLSTGGKKIATWWWGVLLLPLLGFLAALLLALPITRLFANVCVSVSVIGLGFLCFHAGREEKITGFYGAWLACWFVPVIIWAGFFQDISPLITRTLLTLPSLLLGISLLVGTLQRRQNKLEDEVRLRGKIEEQLRQLNASLEDKVEQRTSDLRHMMIGLESFNRSVSHDLRGPLGGMATLARMAHDALGKGDISLVTRALPEMARQAESMHRMVNSLLQLAHVGDCHLSSTLVDVQALVEQMVKDLAIAHPDLPIQNVVQIKSLPSIASDTDLLLPVFVNLIGNALKFAKPGQLPSVEVFAMESSRHEITFCVRDKGIGFDSEKADDLFQPFQRLHGSNVDGHGVGLSIVQRAIERLGGRIWVQAAPNEGASFYFTLPVLPQRQCA
jgi:signal transduction histidine kinase